MKEISDSNESFLDVLSRKLKRYALWNLSDILNPYFWVEVLAEFILCAFILAIVIWALTTINPAAYVPSTTHFGLFAGFVIMAIIEGYGPICGAPINPAGVWGFFVAGRISLVRAIFYIGAEVAGAAAGGMIGFAFTPPAQQQAFGPILPGKGITAAMGMGIEGILTFNLVVVALSCTNPKSKLSIMPSFPIAFCIGTGIMAAGTHTGGLQNPIVPFGPAVATKNFYMHFEVYWAGPFIGATVAAIFYNLTFLAKTYLNHERYPFNQKEGYQEYLSVASHFESKKMLLVSLLRSPGLSCIQKNSQIGHV